MIKIALFLTAISLILCACTVLNTKEKQNMPTDCYQGNRFKVNVHEKLARQAILKSLDDYYKNDDRGYLYRYVGKLSEPCVLIIGTNSFLIKESEKVSNIVKSHDDLENSKLMKFLENSQNNQEWLKFDCKEKKLVCGIVTRNVYYSELTPDEIDELIEKDGTLLILDYSEIETLSEDTFLVGYAINSISKYLHSSCLYSRLELQAFVVFNVKENALKDYQAKLIPFL